MSNHVLLIVNSSYQLMTSIQLKITRYSSDSVDVVLSNQFSGSKKIADNLKVTGLFSKVEYVENNKHSFPNRVVETIRNILIIRRLHQSLGDYDEVCFSNISIFTILFSRIYQRHAPLFSVFEDGFVTYSRAFVSMDKSSILARLINPNGLLSKVSSLYLFSPELLDWKMADISVHRILPINRDNSTTIALLNNIFGYDGTVDIYDRKYIFLEESFYADNFPVDDFNIVMKIANVVGKDNIMVKLHPRNGVNRFENQGIKTNHNYSVPWELIVLNQITDNCHLISISSSAMLQPYLMFGIPIHSYALLNTLRQKPGNMKGELGLFMQQLFSKYPEVCNSPETMDDFLFALSSSLE